MTMHTPRTWRSRLMALGRLGLFATLQVLALLGWVSVWLFIRFALTMQGVSPVVQFLIFQLGLLLTALLAVGLMCRFVERRPLRSVGLAWRAGAGRQLLLGAGLGAAMLSFAVLLGAISGTMHVRAGWAGLHYALGWSIYALAMLLSAVAMELVFRGYLLQVLQDGLGPTGAVLLAALTAAAAQMQSAGAGWSLLVGATAFGLLTGLIALRTRTLWTVIGLHWAWAVFAGGIFGLPRNGLRFGGALFRTLVAGPAWWTGNGYGLDAGLLGGLALLVGWVWYTRWTKTRTPT